MLLNKGDDETNSSLKNLYVIRPIHL